MTETNHTTQENLSRAKVLAKRHHEALWLGSRFLEKANRQNIEAMLAFDGELMRISTTVTEPMIGQIRFQWWLDQIERADADPTGEFPGESFLVLMLNGADVSPDRLKEHVEIREMEFLSERTEAQLYQSLYQTLFSIIAKDADGDKLSEALGELYSARSGGCFREKALKRLIEALQDLPDKFWPLVCVFTLLPKWAKQERISAISQRWQIWKSFISGEASLSGKLRKLLD